MRPIRIEMEGFGAFKHSTVISFVDADLFALVGPTGAGKSTVIDAITFALYGSVARYDDLRTIGLSLNALSNEAKVRLDFEHAGRSYTAVRIMRRQRNQISTREARLLQGDDVLAGRADEMAAAVDEVLGLSFEQFTRTVVLPQGEFARFLRDKPADRQRLLQRLLGFSIYEQMRGLAERRKDASASAARLIESKLDELATSLRYTPEALRAHLTVLNEALRRVKELDAELSGRCAEQSFVAARQATITQHLALLSSIETPVGLDESIRLVSSRQNDLAAATRHLESARQQHHAAQQARADGPDPHAANEGLQLYEVAEHAQVRAATAQGQAHAVAELFVDASAATADDQTVRASIEEALAEERDRLGDHQRGAPAFEASLYQARLERLDELAEVSCSLEIAHQALQSATLDLESARLNTVELTDRLADAEATLTRARELADVAAFRHLLSAGEACPLCEQTVPPRPSGTAPDTDAHPWSVQAAEVDSIRSELETARGREAVCLSRVAASQADFDGLTRQVTSLKSRLAGQMLAGDRPADAPAAHSEADSAGPADHTPVTPAPDRNQTAALLDEARRYENRLYELRHALDQCLQRLEQHDRDPGIRSRRQRADQLAIDVEVAKGRLADTESAAKETAAAIALLPSKEQLLNNLSQSDQLRASEAAAQALVDESSLRHQEAAGQLQQAEGRLADFSTQLEETLQTLHPLEPVRIHTEMPLSDRWATLKTWVDQRGRELSEELAGTERELGHAAAQIDSLRQQRVAAVSPLTHRAEDDTSAAPPAPWPDGPPDEPWSDALVALIGGVQSELERTEHTLARRQGYSVEMAAHLQKAAVAGETATLLRSDRFQRWLMGDALSLLADQASGRLGELVDGQYSLKVADNRFFVVDHRNADEQRDSRTLSGGETFLVSLALALALADLVAELSSSTGTAMESIFLDEGFGTLDVDALDAVAAALEALGAGGRMVGVVTHVRDLADRLPTRFEVSRDLESSSIQRVDR